MKQPTIWHPAIHEREGERLRFCLIDSYRYFLLLDSELPRICDLTGGRLTVYILYGEYDVLLVLWCTDRTFATIRTHLESRLSELASHDPRCFTVGAIPVYAGQEVAPLNDYDLLRWESSEQMDEAQLDFEKFPLRDQFLAKYYRLNCDAFNINEHVKAFIEIRLGDADKKAILELLRRRKPEVLAVYETDVPGHLILEIHVAHGDALWQLVVAIREILKPVRSSRATTYVVANVQMYDHHRCGFEILKDQTANIHRVFSELFPSIGHLPPQEMLLTSAALISWIPFFMDEDMKLRCTSLATAIVERSKERFSEAILAVGSRIEQFLRTRMPAVCAEKLGRDWLETIRNDGSEDMKKDPSLWSIGTRFEIMHRFLQDTAFSLTKAEYTALSSFVRVANLARHERAKLNATHAALVEIQPALEIMHKRKNVFSVKSWQLDE